MYVGEGGRVKCKYTVCLRKVAYSLFIPIRGKQHYGWEKKNYKIDECNGIRTQTLNS